MAGKYTYPGVYVEEVPSGVRTIAGVSTSIAVFLGRASNGPLNDPSLILSIADYERIFGKPHAKSQLAQNVRLFFENGGTQCYVVRIADGAGFSEVILKSEAATNVLKARAKSAGLLGDRIRMVVTYNGLDPESICNLEIFQWGANSAGEAVKEDIEVWQALSMDPDSSRYAEKFVNQNSKLVELEDLGVSPASIGHSQSGRPIPGKNFEKLRSEMAALIGKDVQDTNRIRISVDGSAFAEVDLSNVDVAGASSYADLRTTIANEINSFLTGSSQVDVTFESGPKDENNENTKIIRIASANGDVRIEPASTKDAAAPLMLGTAQGGIEVSRYAQNRPVPNGIVFDMDELMSFAQLSQTAFNKLTIGTAEIELTNSLETSSITGAKMYQDGYSPSVTGGCDGVREKFAIIARAINDKRASDPTFKWSAEVWGSRLALIPGEGGENAQCSVTTGGADGVDIGAKFISNIRYYSLGPSGQGAYQVPTGAPTSDGGVPTLNDYREAFKKIDEEVDLFNLMILPFDEDHNPATVASLWGPSSAFCQQRRAFLLMDPPAAWQTVEDAVDTARGVHSLRTGLVKDHSAIFFPRITIRDNGLNRNIGPSGAIAGLMARIDSNRGVWKVPAGMEADLRGVVGIEHKFSDRQNGVLNPRGINTIRVFPNGIVNWGARTMDGDDDFASEFKYIPVRRLALFIEESLYRGTKWVVFEPNDEPLWSQIRLNIGAFMHSLFRRGAFQGTTPREAYFVKCDKETTTQDDINRGIVNILVGFAPLKPAEFVVIKISQIAGQIQT